MELIKYPDRSKWKDVLKRPAIDNSLLENTVSSILADVKANGDKAVLEYNAKFDGVSISSLQVTPEEIDEAVGQIDEKLKKAIILAKNNIEKFHLQQKVVEKKVETTPGVTCWQRAVAIEKVGLYVPGGTAPLFSTVLMLGIPAMLAGCKEIIVCSPPMKNGKLAASILYTASLIGIKKIYKVGGVQAIGAMAYGTASIPQVYKIFGPGNQYVTAAKQLVNRTGTAIDMPAGPSEVAVIADATSNPAFVASDLLSQAEHGKDSQVLLFTTDENIVPAIEKEVEKQLAALPRKDIATVSLGNSRVIIAPSNDEMMDIVNEYAPEHLIIATDNAMELGMKVINAGSVFLGHLTPESAGDYASGTNHTLPTNGYAKMYSGVNLDSFVKKVTYQHISDYGIFNIGPAIEKMAALEQLDGHKNAVTLRLGSVVNKYCNDKLG
ncbi:MAG TPA: histidinol dehydrogenase [Bacteroidales bacterium]|nr:histidinol dehydrogenase [Bacteroidales bacterium]